MKSAMNPFNRKDYRNRYTDRPRPIVPDPEGGPRVTGKLEQTVQYLNETSGRSEDFVIARIAVANRDAVLVYFQTVIDQKQVQIMIKVLQEHHYPKIPIKRMSDYIAQHVIPFGNVMLMQNLWEIREALSAGQILLLVDGISEAITVGARAVPHRAVESPMIESSTRGPQIAFIEDIDVNIGLIRGMLKSDTFTVKELKVGYRSRTRVAVMYEHDVANPTLVSTVMKRIEAVHVDKLTGSATLEQRIVDNHWTLFPLTRATTRVDNCVKEVGQGKVVIIVESDPTAILVPGTIIDFFQTMEDDQHGYIEATFIRWLRMASFVLSFYLPALYISFSDFNPELMPHVLSLQIARSREGVPFNAVTEVMMMQLVIEIIREAALRMPKSMGQTIGIVGGLVLGQAAVAAGLVSNILIVIIALTAVSVFVMPSYDFAVVLRILSWVNIFAASVFGFYGVMLVVIGVIFHVGSLKSFGVPYIEPLSGEHWRDFFLDGILRAPLPMLDKRAEHLHDQEETRGADYTDPNQHPMLEIPKQPPSRRNRGQT